MKRTDDETLANCMFILSAALETEDGVANAAIYEAGERIQQFAKDRAEIIVFLKRLPKVNNQTYVGKDKISYGEQAKQLIAKLGEA